MNVHETSGHRLPDTPLRNKDNSEKERSSMIKQNLKKKIPHSAGNDLLTCVWKVQKSLQINGFEEPRANTLRSIIVLSTSLSSTTTFFFRHLMAKKISWPISSARNTLPKLPVVEQTTWVCKFSWILVHRTGNWLK